MTKFCAVVLIILLGTNPAFAQCAMSFTEYAPANAPEHAALVVALHGCGQSASDLARDAGWNKLADRFGFYVLYPQQPNCSNTLGCFNWFDPQQITRGHGEVRAIKEKIDDMKAHHSIDPARIYVAGFSAGAAMGVALLASYPDVFTAGAVMSGLPYKIATSSNEAWMMMSMSRELSPREWGDLVRQSNPGYTGSYPRVVFFHGASDFTVNPKNSKQLVKQWTDLQGIDTAPSSEDTVAGHRHTTYKNAGGTPVVELFEIRGMAHAIAVAPGSGEQQGGQAGRFSTDVGLYAPYRALSFWGLTH